MTSRDRFNNVTTGKRFVGFYRRDSDYIHSGKAPLEAVYYASDLETRKTLKEMNRSAENTNPFATIDQDELSLFLDEYTPIYNEEELEKLNHERKKT